MPKGGYPDTVRTWPVPGRPDMHIVLLKPGDVPYPISDRIAEKHETFKFNLGLRYRKPGTFKWIYAGPSDGRETGVGQIYRVSGRG